MKPNKTISEFKEFIAKGNVMDMAVGVIIGGAFGKIVTSLVNDILMPIVGILIGGLDFTGLKIQVGTATITYGNFIQNVVDFLIEFLSALSTRFLDCGSMHLCNAEVLGAF